MPLRRQSHKTGTSIRAQSEKILLGAFVILFVGSMSSICSAGTKKTRFPGEKRRQGFHDSILSKLASGRPDLYRQISEQPTDNEPVTVFRGLSVDPLKFNSAHVPSDSPLKYLKEGNIFVAGQLSGALGFAIGFEGPNGKGQRGTVIELQVPRSLIKLGDPSGVSVIRVEDMRDSRLFLKRIGSVDLSSLSIDSKSGQVVGSDGTTSGRNKVEIRWYDFDQVAPEGKVLEERMHSEAPSVEVADTKSAVSSQLQLSRSLRQAESPEIDAVLRLGYDESVVERLSKLDPVLLRQILSKQDNAPVRLFLYFGERDESIDLNQGALHFGGPIIISAHPHSDLWYGPSNQSILEVQVPRFLYHQHYRQLRTDGPLDLGLFATRVGKQDAGTRITQWYDFLSVLVDGRVVTGNK